VCVCDVCVCLTVCVCVGPKDVWNHLLTSTLAGDRNLIPHSMGDPSGLPGEYTLLTHTHLLSSHTHLLISHMCTHTHTHFSCYVLLHLTKVDE